jgi:hypothetical protein
LANAREKRYRLQALRHVIVDETPLCLVLRPHEPARSADDEQVYVLHDFPRLDASEVFKARRTVGSDEQLVAAEALATLVEVMRDKTASASARVRASELVLDRAHGKVAPVLEQPRDPDFVPLAERIKWYMRRDAVDAAKEKVVQILPPKKRALPPATDQALREALPMCRNGWHSWQKATQSLANSTMLGAPSAKQMLW